MVCVRLELLLKFWFLKSNSVLNFIDVSLFFVFDSSYTFIANKIPLKSNMKCANIATDCVDPTREKCVSKHHLISDKVKLNFVLISHQVMI